MATNFKRLFAFHRFYPDPDEGLTTLLNRGLEYMSEDELVAYIQKVKKFDKTPVHITESLPGQFLIDLNHYREEYWHFLRKDLEILPQYFDTAEKLNLTHKERVDLLFSLVDSYKYDFHGITDYIKTLTKIMGNCVEKDLDFKASLPQFKILFKEAYSDGEIGRALGITQLGIAAGMNIQQSIEIVTDIYKKSCLPGYVFMALYDELDALATNNANGDLIFNALKTIMGDKDPYYRQGIFSSFTELLHTAATHSNYSQTEILEKIIAQKQKKKATDNKALVPKEKHTETELEMLIKAAKELMPALASNESKLPPPTKEPDDYFPDIKTKKLIHGILPYRAKRNLAEGLSDLHDLMTNELKEGAWTFDPKSDTWYSFGGRTRFESGRVRQEFSSYDIAKLSTAPIFVHIHPEESEIFITPNRDVLAHTQLQKKVTKFFAAMPSSADFETIANLMKDASQPVPLSSLIVTSTGLTEIKMPNDPKSISRLAETFTELKDQVLLEFDAAGYLDQLGIGEPNLTFVQRLIAPLNQKLPDGFKIIIHDYNQPINLNTPEQGLQKTQNQGNGKRDFPVALAKLLPAGARAGRKHGRGDRI